MSLNNDLVFLILQFLNEEKHTEAAHMLEKESGLYFNLDYLQELVLTGKFDEAERYLLGFIKVEDNKHSTKIFFEIRKQKYLEALDRKDRFTAMNILKNDLKVFRNISKEVYREITELITLEDFRENEQLKQYRDTQSQRIAMFREISSIVQSNPLICNKLTFPSIKACRLRALINQSLNLQHTLCKNPQPIPDVRTLFSDHTCAPSNGALTPSPVNNNLTLCKNPQPTPDVRTLFADHTCAASNGALTPSPVNNHLMGSIQKMPANGVSSTSMVDVKQRLQDEGTGENESTNWKFTEVMEPVHCKSIRLTDPLPTAKIVKLLYTYSGSCLLALDSNAAHKLWMWQRNALNPSGKVKANVQPQIWQPPNNTLMKNDTSDRSLEDVVPCLALSRNDSYIISASGGSVCLFNIATFKGGSVSFFNIATFKVIKSFMPPPPAATCLAFNPFDNNIIAIGMEDSTILVFNIRLAEVIMKLKGHQKRITGLAFSKDLNVLASSGADGQLCVWNINGWEQCKSKGINSQAGRFPSPIAVTTVQFNNINQAQLLVVQESQIAIYDASELECLCHWTPQEPMPAHISCATFSCDGLLVYASFFDGSIGVFDSEVLRPRCRIAPSAFIPDMGSGDIYPLVIAANPHVPNQIAVGLIDGGVHVIELDT